ncbi:hypothetical protein BD626DRAFT_573252 [Schizophyllum amplum]|uniref:F-box domain-containing protein n=1 Tax=Schizophyllum amplum TaxID=97359 RepID=A0A550C1S2_9AGAR|nr:hypothetical protein BD626DRAFT_573252 [Auriculariopsis ampla]
MATLDTLPDEVLESILTDVVDDEGGLLFSVAFAGPAAASAVLLVSRRWRATARIWTHVRVHLDAELADRSAQVFARAVDALQRSGDLSLRIELRYEARHIASFRAYAPTQDLDLGPLMRTSARWETADLYIPDACYGSPAFQAMRGALPRLRALSISVTQLNPTLYVLPEAIDTFSDCPTLESVTVGNSILYPLLNLPWANLKDLTLHGLSVDEVILRLQVCAVLERLTVHVIPQAMSINPTVCMPFIHPTIRVLRIAHSSFDTTRGELLKRLQLPSLAELSLTFKRELLTQWSQKALAEFLVRSNQTRPDVGPCASGNSNLTSLTLRRPNLGYNQLIDLLKLTPTLISFTLADGRPDIDQWQEHDEEPWRPTPSTDTLPVDAIFRALGAPGGEDGEVNKPDVVLVPISPS